MIRITLTDAEKEQLGQTFKTTSEPYLRDRCQAVLMAARGRKHGQIAEDLGVHRVTVQEWLRQYRQGGLVELHIHWGPGQPARIPQTLASEILAWVKGGPQSCGLNRANWTFAELAHHLYQTHGIEVSETTMREFCHRLEIRPYRPTYRFLRPNPQKQEMARQELAELKQCAIDGECILLSQDEARFPMVPTLQTTLGVKGHRPVVGTDDNKALVYTFAAVNVLSGQLTTRLIDSPARATAKTGKSKTRRLQEAFAKHLRDIARAYPADQHAFVVLTIDNAPWHRGRLINEVLDEFPHLKLYRLPSYSPRFNVIERLWKLLRRRATHNRFFATVAELRRALRASLCYFQTLRHRILSLISAPKAVVNPAAS
jgi:transposase